MKSNLVKINSPARDGANKTCKVITCLGLIIAFVLVSAVRIEAQQQGEQPTKTQIGPRPELQQAYRPAPRDPFRREVKKPEKTSSPRARVQAKPEEPKPVAFPPPDVRRAEFRRMVDQAIARDLPEPDPISQYLVSELDLMGVFRDGRGFGAFVRAHPTGTTFFVRSGSRVYNGEVLRIEDDASAGASQIHFREITYMEFNGKRSPQERVVTKTPTTATNKK